MKHRPHAAALPTHGVRGSGSSQQSPSPVFSSTIIATVGRATLSRSVESVLAQDFDPAAHEVIVVNDSGHPLAVAAWQRDKRVQVLHTPQRERCVARNAGAAIARGTYLHFLDDDDWLLPGALAALTDLAARHARADWLYGGARFVDRRDEPIIDFRPEFQHNAFTQMMAGEWIPLQISLIRATAFAAVGGFPPALVAGQDKYLLRRITLRGDLAGTQTVIGCIQRGDAGSLTDYARVSALSRGAREVVLAQPGVFDRMHRSAGSAYWRGKMIRVYLTSAGWNLARGHVLRAAERVVHAIAAAITAGPRLLSPRLWAAVARPHAGRTYARAFAAPVAKR